MELNYSEMDTLDNTNKYWEVSKSTEPKQKPKFGYDDILSSINLVVKDGVLQYMTPATNDNAHVQHYDNSNNYNNKNSNNNNSNNNNSNNKPTVRKVSIDPNVKNSAIYNKYFKNYKDPNEVREIKIPKTREEYKQMVIEEHNKRVELQRRLAQIKPKTMFFFGSQNSQQTIQSSQTHTTFNQFFKLNKQPKQ